MKASRFKFRAGFDEGHDAGLIIVEFELGQNNFAEQGKDGQWYTNLELRNAEWIVQSTGLLDVNGKEIFEGDVVRKHWGWIGGEDIFRNHDIRFYREENEMAWHLGDCHNLWDNGDVEIIGNIYANPELLDTAE